MTISAIALEQDQAGIAGHLNRIILRRAAIVALVLGTALTLANQWSAVFGRAEFALLPLAQVYLTPFLVVALSQILGIRQAHRNIARGHPAPKADEKLARTMFRHGIPRRAVLTGLAVGAVNAIIVSMALLVEQGSLVGFEVGVAAQAVVLPILFGLLSQALAYRSTMVTPR